MAAAGFKVAMKFMEELAAKRAAAKGKGGGGMVRKKKKVGKADVSKKKVQRQRTGRGTGPQGLMKK